MKFELIISEDVEQIILNNNITDNYFQKKEHFISNFKKEFLIEFNKINNVHSFNLSTIILYVLKNEKESIKASLNIEKSNVNSFTFIIYENSFLNFIIK